MERIKKRLGDFLELTRAYALATTIASCVIILAKGIFCPCFNVFHFILLALALCSVHLGANLYDDYVDIQKKLKAGLKLHEINFGSYVPKAKLILNGQFSMEKVEAIISGLFLFASIIGLHFIILQGWQIVIYMFLGALLTLFYPISAKYCLSEVTIGLIYGPLMINGGYYALFGKYDLQLAVISIAVFFSVLVLLHSHNLMDYEFDIKEGKNTLCVLLKDKNKAINFLKFIIFMAYFIIVFGVLFLGFSKYMLYVFFTLPLAVKLPSSLTDYINIKDVKFEPRWYYGPFENWNNILKDNIAFYMYRLYLARNFLLFFAIFAAIGAII